MPSDWRVANEMSFIVLLFVWLAEEMREKKRCRKSKYLAISGQMNESTHIPNRAKKGVKTRSVELIECTTREISLLRYNSSSSAWSSVSKTFGSSK